MQISPINPPPANVEERPSEVVRRPISVWLLQILLAVTILLILYGLLRWILTGVSLQIAQLSPIGFALGIAWRVALITALAVTIRCIHRGPRFARWLGVAVISGFAALILMGEDTTRYANEAERSGGFIARNFFMPLLLVWWIYAVAFSHKAKQYFSKR